MSDRSILQSDRSTKSQFIPKNFHFVPLLNNGGGGGGGGGGDKKD